MQSLYGIAERAERQLSYKDKKRKKLILDTKRKNPSLTPKKIAGIAECTAEYVRKILRDQAKPVKANVPEPAPLGHPVPEAGHGAQAKPGAASNPKWFERAVADSLPGLDPLLESLRRGEKRPTLSTDLRDPSQFRVISDEELMENTFPNDLNSNDPEVRKRSREWLRYHFSGEKRSAQGFVIMAAHIEADGFPSTDLFEGFPELLEKNQRYAKELKTIFQTLQSKRPKGDGKRLQAKMTALVALSKVRVKEANDVVEKEKKRKRTPDNLPAALQVLEKIQKEHDLIQEATYAMCRGYARIQKVWPGTLHMPRAVSDTDRIAALATVSGATEQSFHRDSLEPGNSGITAYGEDQDIYILWNSFFAMIVLEELLADRKEATELLRSCWNLSPGPGCSDEEWASLEPSAWDLLVHCEFKARGVQNFEVVRVPIQKTKTVVVDSRTSHAGSPWKASSSRQRLYRGHFYGFRQDVVKRPADVLGDKDEITTVDLCDEDYFPIVTWAQRGDAPIFAQK